MRGLTKKPTYYHLTPSGEHWSVRRSGASRAAKRFWMFAEALAYARDLAESNGGILFIHGPNGRIASREDHS